MQLTELITLYQRANDRRLKAESTGKRLSEVVDETVGLPASQRARRVRFHFLKLDHPYRAGARR